MKELKAVEILTLLQRVDDVSTRQMQKEIQEALVELDELTQEKSCERCEHSKDIAELEAMVNKMKCCENCKSHINIGSECLLDMEDRLTCKVNNYSNWKLKDNK